MVIDIIIFHHTQIKFTIIRIIYISIYKYFSLTFATRKQSITSGLKTA